MIRNHRTIAVSVTMLLLAILACDLPIPTSEPDDTPTLYVAGTDTPEPGADTATPDPSATPTPQPVLRLIYTKSGSLYVSENGGPPVMLTSGGNDYDPMLSPDGTEVLFKRELPLSLAGLYRFELRVIGVDGTAERVILSPADLPGEMGTPMDAPAPVLLDQQPHQVAWMPQSHGIAFTSRIEAGMGQNHQDDLWLVDLDTDTLTEFLPSGDGGTFAYSPDETLLVVSSVYTVTMLNADGTNRRNLVTFGYINTASEYSFRPWPVWAPDSSYALVAIPSTEPFAPGATAELWQLPALGSAASLATLAGQFLFSARDGQLWSPDTLHIAYAAPSSTPGDEDLIVADGGGGSPTVYATSPNLDLVTWVPDSSHFVFWQNNNPGEDYVGQVGVAPQRLIPLAVADRIHRLVWADDVTFAGITGSVNSWTVQLGEIGGPVVAIDTCPDPQVGLTIHR